MPKMNDNQISAFNAYTDSKPEYMHKNCFLFYLNKKVIFLFIKINFRLILYAFVKDYQISVYNAYSLLKGCEYV